MRHGNPRGGQQRQAVRHGHRVGDATPTAIQDTDTDTITGGTGRFAGASGTYTKTGSFVVVSVTATSQTSHFTSALDGQISY